jgi:hypothetical protein
MINKYEWLKNVLNTLKEIADPEFQQRVWVDGAGPEISDWTEVMCKLFDDFHFDDFIDIDWQQFGLSSESHQLLVQLREQLNNYEEKETNAEIVADPKWQEISKFAGNVLAHLERDIKAKLYTKSGS